MADIKWVLEEDGEFNNDPVHGVPGTADVTINVRPDDGDGQEFYVDCHCGACEHIANVGVQEAMGFNRDEAVPGGTHFMEFFVEEFKHPEGVEYDAGLRYTEGEK